MTATGDTSFSDVPSKDALIAILEKSRRDRLTSSIEALDSSLLINAAPGVENDTLNWSDVCLDKQIACGSFGVVHSGSIFGTPCAVKIFKKIGSSLKMKISELRKEIDIMRRIRHPNVVSLLGVSTSPSGETVILMELMKGTLNDYRRLHPDSNPFDRLRIARDIARGLSWLHTRSPPILHLDLKFDNVLFDSYGIMKVTDFGLSAFLPEEYIISELRLPGNIGHMAPELISRQEFNTKADVFSFAIMLWEIMRGLEWEEEIFEHLQHYKIRAAGDLAQIVKAAIVYKNFRPVIPDDWLPELRDALQLAWHQDMTLRPTMGEILTLHLPTIEAALAERYVRSFLGFDPTAGAFWLAHFRETIPSPVPANEFIEALYRFMSWPWPRDPGHDLSLAFLQLALDVLPADGMYAPGSACSVSIERFSKVVNAFGPLQRGSSQFFASIEDTLGSEWFHPEEESTAPNFLLGQPTGTFIVRFSKTPGYPFALTRVVDSSLVHSRIQKLPDGSFQLMSLPNRTFPMLKALVGDPDVIALLGLHSAKHTSLTRAQQLRARFKEICYDDDDLTHNMDILSSVVSKLNS